MATVARRAQPEQRRPPIALIEVRPGRFHYVVILSWSAGKVVVHDPGAEAFRGARRGGLPARRGTDPDDWTLVALPARACAPRGGGGADAVPRRRRRLGPAGRLSTRPSAWRTAARRTRPAGCSRRQPRSVRRGGRLARARGTRRVAEELAARGRQRPPRADRRRRRSSTRHASSPPACFSRAIPSARCARGTWSANRRWISSTCAASSARASPSPCTRCGCPPQTRLTPVALTRAARRLDACRRSWAQA